MLDFRSVVRDKFPFILFSNKPTNHLFMYIFTDGSDYRESACNAIDSGSIPGLGRSFGEGSGYPLQYSCLENSMDRGAWQTTVCEVSKSQTRWATSSNMTGVLIIEEIWTSREAPGLWGPRGQPWWRSDKKAACSSPGEGPPKKQALPAPGPLASRTGKNKFLLYKLPGLVVFVMAALAN